MATEGGQGSRAGLLTAPAAGKDSSMTSLQRMESSADFQRAAAAGKCQRYFSPLLKAKKFTGGSRRKGRKC